MFFSISDLNCLLISWAIKFRSSVTPENASLKVMNSAEVEVYNFEREPSVYQSLLFSIYPASFLFYG